MLHRFPVLLQLSIWPDRLLRRLLGLVRRFFQRLDAFVDLFQLFRAIAERGEALADVVEPRGDGGRFFGDVLERFAERGELGAARGERGQHGADGAALFARRGDERLQLICLLLDELASAAGDVLEGVQHVWLPTWKW